MIKKLNTWNNFVNEQSDNPPQLTYVVETDPSPLTASLSSADPSPAALRIVITNNTGAAITDINQISFTLQAGANASLMQATGDLKFSSTDPGWEVPDKTPVTQAGPVTCTVTPPGSIANQASVVITIYNFSTVLTAQSSSFEIQEHAPSNPGPPPQPGGVTGSANVWITTFPADFFFERLTVNTGSGSNLTPVAQVNKGDTVTLSWKTSVTNTDDITISYSDPSQYQQTATPTHSDQWISQALTDHTVFAVSVNVHTNTGPVTVTRQVAVYVQNPAIIASSVTTTEFKSGNGAFNFENTTNNSSVFSLNAGAGSTTATINTSGGTNSWTQLEFQNSSEKWVMGTSNNYEGNEFYLWNSQYGASGQSSLSLSPSAGLLTLNAQMSIGDGGNNGVFYIPEQNNGSIHFRSGNQSSYKELTIIDSSGDMTVTGSLNANSINTTGGYVTLCDAPDYSQGTVGIGGAPYSNVMLYVCTNQTEGSGVYIDTPNLKPGWSSLYSNGPCLNTSGSWINVSDMSLKEKVAPFDDGLEQLLKINPISFHYTQESGLGSEDKRVGVSAQDLEQIAPNMVSKMRLKPDADEEHLCVDNGPIKYMLINAVKELKAEVDELKKELEALKNR